MIQRKPSTINNSIVNSSHEDHLNVTKAIRDDYPLTNLTSCVKSINFEAAGDGSYILRKPLFKKDELVHTNESGIITEQFYLFTNTYKGYFIQNDLAHTKELRFSGPQSTIVRFYDNNGIKHDLSYSVNVFDIQWLTINKIYNTNDHTIISAVIDHPKFLEYLNDKLPDGNIIYNTYSEDPTDPSSEEISVPISWKYTLTNTTPFVGGDITDYETLEELKRFIRIYKSEDEENTLIFEIIRPELNTITSGLDVGNANTLDINLLLDNPYAIRDLYGYGYVSTTKILAYVCTDNEDDTEYSHLDFSNDSIWKLTEEGNYYKILVSANPKTFNYTHIFLKAFLTTAITNSSYYCCWEESTDGGITWGTCQEFINQNPNVEDKLVSDITSKDFDEASEESLEKAASYLVTKKLVKLNLNLEDFSQDDLIGNRPDVLVLTTPDITKHYRFLIYIETNKPTPTPVLETHTVITPSLSTSGTIVEALDSSNNAQAKITYSTGNGLGAEAPSANGGILVLNDSAGFASSISPYNDRRKYPSQPAFGNTFSINVLDSAYKLKKISITLDVRDATARFLGGAIAQLKVGTAFPSTGHMIIRDGPLTFYQYFKDVNYFNIDYYGKQDGNTAHPKETLDFNPSKNSSYWVTPGGTYEYTPNDPEDTSINLAIISRAVGDTYTIEKTGSTYDVGAEYQRPIKVKSISVTYTTSTEVPFTNMYLTSSTGDFILTYSDNTELPKDLSKDRDRIFASTSNYFYLENQYQLLVYKDRFVYMTGTNSSIIKLMTSLTLPEEVTKIIAWRGYLLLFSAKNIYLASYDSSIDGYNCKVLSNTVGVSKEDADTIVAILNSVYFKSKDKIYKLVPNLYAASDDILNIHQISTGVNSILEDITHTYIETHNFSYANSETYMVFIPITSEGYTLCICYDFVKQVWTLQKYYIILDNVDKSIHEVPTLIAGYKYFYFTETLISLINTALTKYPSHFTSPITIAVTMKELLRVIPYADYLEDTPEAIISGLLQNSPNNAKNITHPDYAINQAYPIEFELDFGQKSSNYTLDKQFLETKIILATLSDSDKFPFSLDIYTDGISRELHWDANTDGALWENNSTGTVGILDTTFGVTDQDYNGILRQLIVKYSGKGKSIRHIISGTSKYLFKFYSMDVRSRILPKKR